MTPSLPAVIGRYEIEEELGRGTMGVVYRARDPRWRRPVALKTLAPNPAFSPAQAVAFENRFFAEGRIAAGLSHPGIVRVYESGRDPHTRTLFLALEYVEGRTLQDLLTAAPLPWRRALSIAAQVAEALGHAHARGVVHRDVKPANVLLLPSGEIKLTDFGLARLEGVPHATTLTGKLFGTPLYMSPEQAMGEPVDGRSDLFSLGAILYGLLTGRRAFGADAIPAILRRVVHEEPIPPCRLVPDLPARLDGLLARLLAKRPSDRYPSGHALSADIASLLAPRPHLPVFEPADTARMEALFDRLW
jgi:serine/threonine-protein kinase